MKSLFDSAKHTAIREQREKDKTAARLWEITGDKALRILTNQLTRNERLWRRIDAWLTTSYRINKLLEEHPPGSHVEKWLGRTTVTLLRKKGGTRPIFDNKL